jgi:hypothetical protein
MKNYIILISTIFAFIVNISFISSIGNEINSAIQENYLLDAYYYNFLGNNLRNFPVSEYFSILYEISPTTNSIGIIFISYILSILIEYTYIPIFFGLIYFYIFNKINENKETINNFLCLSLIGTSPLLFITSKESFLLIGIIILFQSISTFGYRKFIYFIIGSLIVILSRYEVIIFLYLSIGFAYGRIYLKRLILSSAVILLLFYYNNIFDLMYLYEVDLLSKDLAFCGFGYMPTCLNTDSNIIIILLSRLLFTFLLPFKWLYSGYESLYYLDNFSNFYNRISQFLFAIFLIPLISFFFKNKNKINSKLLKLGIYFFYSYTVFYSIVLFHQPTRQIQFAIVILFLSITLSKYKNPT